VIGTLEDSGVFSIQIEGVQKHCTDLQIDITGTEGVLKISNKLAFQNEEDNAIEGMNGNEKTFPPLPVPAEYQSLALPDLDASVQDVVYLYDAYARDRQNGTIEASNFKDALTQHRLID
jgi:predicted dehydrogenase